MTENATADVRSTPAAPALAAVEDKATAPAPAIDTIVDDDIGPPATPAGDGKQEADGQPAERPVWACPEDEEAAEAWREERNIPADPDDYELPVDQDHLTDVGRETIQGFQEVAHALSLPQETASKLYEFTAQRAREIMDARVEQDRAEAASAKQVLAEQWGADAGNNLKAVNALLKKFPSGLSKAIRDARSGNGLGSRLTNDAAFLSMLSEYAALKAGGSTAGIFDGQADEKRITEIKRARSDDFDKYIRHGLDGELATIEARQAARAPAGEGERPGDRAREAEIRKILKADSNEYFQRGLDKELTQILNRRGTA